MSSGPTDDDPRPAKLRRIESGVESRLARMAEAGELSGLPGGDRDARVRSEVAEAVQALNLKVHQFNSLVPVDSLQLVPFSVARFIG